MRQLSKPYSHPGRADAQLEPLVLPIEDQGAIVVGVVIIVARRALSANLDRPLIRFPGSPTFVDGGMRQGTYGLVLWRYFGGRGGPCSVLPE